MAKYDVLRKVMLPWLWLTALVIALDQISKRAAETMLVFHQPHALFTGFNFTLMHNEGAAFSFLSNAGGWQRWFFIALSIAVSIALIAWLTRLARSQVMLAAGLALILGGAIGNVIDRILLGHVIDFIDVYYGYYHWPAFNLADSAISLGAVLLIIDMLYGDKTHD
jgi:signal peptidase II